VKLPPQPFYHWTGEESIGKGRWLRLFEYRQFKLGPPIIELRQEMLSVPGIEYIADEMVEIK